MIDKFLENPYWLAPMAGYTDAAFRQICLGEGAGLVETEMVSTKGLCYGSENSRELLHVFGAGQQVAVQLFGCEPEFFAAALDMPELAHFGAIGINMGCPMPKVVKTGAGSALLNTPALASQIIRTVVDHARGRPVLVKFRIGWDRDHIFAADFARMCEDSGASALTVHGRTREQMYMGRADWGIVDEVARSVNIPVIGNGDITTASEAQHRLKSSAVSGVAIARGALGNPWIFADCVGREPTLGPLETIEHHYELLTQILPVECIVPLMRGHLNYYMRRLCLGAKLRDQLNREKDMHQILTILKNCIN